MGEVKIVNGPDGVIVVVYLPSHMKLDSEKKQIEEAAKVLQREVLRESVNRSRANRQPNTDILPERPFPDR